MYNAVKIFIGIFAFFLLLNVPLLKISNSPTAKPVYIYDLKTHSSISSTNNSNLNEFIFHLPVSGDYYSSHQFDIVKLDKKGNSLFSFTAPSKKDIYKTKETTSLENKDGFFTYPPNGSFFLWYPKLGNYTFFYDQSGEFLWSHKSSHYLKAFPSGEFLLAMTGDHSRAFFLLPDLTPVGSTEGALLINYQFSINPKDDKSMKICLGYLDGDIVFYNPKQNNQIRINTGGVTKSIACDFDNLGFAVHMEGENNSPDIIKTAKIDSTQKIPKITWKGSIKLTTNYNFTIPVGIQNNFIVVLLPTGSNLSLFTYNLKGDLLTASELSPMDTPIEDWRLINLQGSIAAWNSKSIYIMNPDIILQKHIPIENVTVIENQLFIQTSKEIISYKLEN
jgi:hypothetical protein